MATVIGLIHAGQLNLDALKELTDIVVDPYTSGLHDEDDDVSMATVRHGFLGTLVVRSALSVIPLHRLADPPTAELANLFQARVRLTRYLVDLGLTQLHATSAAD
jgi:hypothetical protein